MLVLARFEEGRRTGGGCSEYVPAGGGYRGIVIFYLLQLFSCVMQIVGIEEQTRRVLLSIEMCTASGSG
jgi:hypothetical protein